MLKMIIADDEIFVLEHMSNILHWEDYNIEVVGLYTDGKQVINHLKSQPADIIISDIKMPFCDGLTIAEYCFEKNLDTDIILISAFREFEYARSAIKYGVSSYITKPYTSETIEEAINNVIRKKTLPSDIISSFSSNIEYQSVFSDIFCGNISSENDIKHAVTHLNISDNGGKILNFEILNFENYINNDWKYGEIRFFNAISTLAFLKTDTSCFSIIRAKSNSFLLLALSDDEKEINEYIGKLTTSLKAILNVDCRVDSAENFSSLKELIGYSSSASFFDNDFLQKINTFIAENYTKDITLDEAASALCLNKTYFCALYKKYTNETFIETLKRMRLEKAKDLLVNSTVKVSLIYELVGYKSKPYFYKLLKEQFGITPIEYRQIYGKKE